MSLRGGFTLVWKGSGVWILTVESHTSSLTGWFKLRGLKSGSVGVSIHVTVCCTAVALTASPWHPGARLLSATLAMPPNFPGSPGDCQPDRVLGVSYSPRSLRLRWRPAIIGSRTSARSPPGAAARRPRGAQVTEPSRRPGQRPAAPAPTECGGRRGRSGCQYRGRGADLTHW